MLFFTSLSTWIWLILITCAKVIATQDTNMTILTIPLDKATTIVDKKLYDEFVTLNQMSALKVNFNKISTKTGFIIFQVHSHLYNITLYKNVEVKNHTVRGTNVGLHSDNMEQDTFIIKNLNKDINLKLYVAIHGYSTYDPIPGACNSESSLTIPVPSLTAIYNRDYLKVDIGAPGLINDTTDCAISTIEYIDIFFFMLYLPEQNFNSDVYFDAIMNMTSLESIQRNGNMLPSTKWYNRRMVASYPGTGAVFVAVAKITYIPNSNYYSVYVPTTSYACSPVEEDCELMEDSLSQFMCAGLFFIGVFICYFGHRFFKTQTFFIGFLSGLLVTYILMSLILNLDRPATLAASALSGVFIGATRVVYWWIYGLPVFSIILSAADVGFLTSSLVIYAAPEEYWRHPFFLHLDVNFWSIFVLIITLVTIGLLSINTIANLICCAIIGAYAVILPIDFYVGSNMKYILINIERRATVTDFEKVLRVPIFQYKDGILSALWLVLSVTGFIYQYYENRGRPPFPPPPRSVRAVPEGPAPIAVTGVRRRSGSQARPSISKPERYNERTPLLRA